MIEEIVDLPEGTLGFKLSGKVTGQDYDDVLTPSIDKAVEKYDLIKALIQIGPDFEGYNLEAAWDDTKLGMRYWSGFQRIAIVTDISWVRTSIRAMGVVMPCPVKIFSLNEVDSARRWLSESLGTIHLAQEEDLITIRLIGQLEPSAYDGIESEISNLMSKAEHVKLLLDLREFEGWSGITALGNHLSLIREFRRVPIRVAIVGDQAWQKLAEKVISQFINAATEYFTSADYEKARSWLIDK